MIATSITCVVISFSLFASIVQSVKITNSTLFKTIENAVFKNEIGKSIIQLDVKPSPFEMHTVIFGLKHMNLDKLDTLLEEISDPRNEKYGQYLSSEEISQLCLPSQTSIKYVESYLNTVGHYTSIPLFKVVRKTLSGEYLSVTGPIWAFNILFNTEFHRFKNNVKNNNRDNHIKASTQTDSTSPINDEQQQQLKQEQQTALRAFSYSLPLELIEHVAGVFHTIQHPFAVYPVTTSHLKQTPLSHGTGKNTAAAESDTTTETKSKEKKIDESLEYTPHSRSLASSSVVTKTTTSTISKSRGEDTLNKPAQSTAARKTTTKEQKTKQDGVETKTTTAAVTATTALSPRPDPPYPTLPWYYLDGYMTPNLFRAHYDVFNKGTNSSPTQAVYASIGQTYSMSDLLAFETVFELDQTPIIHTHNGHKVTGTCNRPDSCLEANLDMQYMIGVAQGVPTTYWYEADYSTSSFTIFLADVNNDPNPPKVISISYGMCECIVTPIDKYFFDLEARKLLLRGVTLVAASGDSGATNAQQPETCGYNPIFPTTSIYVTSVGATQGAEMRYMKEVACQMNKGGVVTSGGGFSYIYATPSWQKATADRYFRVVMDDPATTPYQDPRAVAHHSNDPEHHRGRYDYDMYPAYPNPLYNRYGRGFPDISVAGLNYLVVTNMSFYALSGTSASAPVFAAMIGLINAARAERGRNTLGWINPALYLSQYKNPPSSKEELISELGLSSLTEDIDDGDNKCYGFEREDQCCQEGFYGTSGWDPVTGLGAARYRQLYDYFIDLPSPTRAVIDEEARESSGGGSGSSDGGNSGSAGGGGVMEGNTGSGTTSGSNTEKVVPPNNSNLDQAITADSGSSNDGGTDNKKNKPHQHDGPLSFVFIVTVLVVLFVILGCLGYDFRSRNHFHYSRLSSIGIPHDSDVSKMDKNGNSVVTAPTRRYGTLGVEILQTPKPQSKSPLQQQGQQTYVKGVTSGKPYGSNNNKSNGHNNNSSNSVNQATKLINL